MERFSGKPYINIVKQQIRKEGLVLKTVINTVLAPQAIGPYCQAVKANGFLFLSGQIPLDPFTGQIVYGGIETQTSQVMNNIKAILDSEGLSFHNVVKTTVFIKDLNDFAKMNKIYGDYFGEEPPARSCVEVSRLPKDVLVEVEVIAVY